jgi:hypothetical protein
VNSVVQEKSKFQHNYPRIHTSNITHFPRNNSESRSAFTKHLPQISNQFVRFFMRSKMTSAIVLRLENNISVLEPPGIRNVWMKFKDIRRQVGVEFGWARTSVESTWVLSENASIPRELWQVQVLKFDQLYLLHNRHAMKLQDLLGKTNISISR